MSEKGKITHITGDLLKSKRQYLVHQTNCISKGCKGLAVSVFEQFPYANVYKERVLIGYADRPGTIAVRGNTRKGEQLIIALYGQYNPGYPDNESDSAEKRLFWFQCGLKAISQLDGIIEIAFPHGIGCGNAGGNWDKYYHVIQKWAENHPHINVFVYELPDNKNAPPAPKRYKANTVSSI